MSEFSLDDLIFKLDTETQCCDPTSPFFGCSAQEVLQARYAAEYVRNGPHVECELWISADQFERRPEGPDPTDAPGEEWDPAYGEPWSHVRPRDDQVVEEGWDFRGPFPFLSLITEVNSDYTDDEKGGGKDRTVSITVARFAICQAVAAGVGGGADAGKGLGCPSAFVFDPTVAPAVITLEDGTIPPELQVFRNDRPRHGDVIFVASGWNEFFDVDRSSRQGYTQGAKESHTYFDLDLIRRSKYLPRRKDILPNSEYKALGNKAGTEFLRDDQRPRP